MDVSNIKYTAMSTPEFFVGALASAHTVESDYIRVIPNVTKDAIIKKLVLTGNTISQEDNRDCNWAPTKRMTADSVTLSVNNYKINEEQCLDSLDNLYSEEVFRTGRSEGADKTVAPDNFSEAVMYLVQKGLSADIERLIWTGSTASSSSITSGLLGQAIANSGSGKPVKEVKIDVATDPKKAVEQVYLQIPEAVLSEAETDSEKAALRFFTSAANVRKIKTQLGALLQSNPAVYQPWAYTDNKLTYMGHEIVGNPFIDSDYMLCFSRDNAVFGTDLLSDTTSVEVEQGQSLKDKNIMYIKGAYRAGTSFIFLDEVVFAHKA